MKAHIRDDEEEEGEEYSSSWVGGELQTGLCTPAEAMVRRLVCFGEAFIAEAIFGPSKDHVRKICDLCWLCIFDLRGALCNHHVLTCSGLVSHRRPLSTRFQCRVSMRLSSGSSTLAPLFLHSLPPQIYVLICLQSNICLLLDAIYRFLILKVFPVPLLILNLSLVFLSISILSEISIDEYPTLPVVPRT